MAPTRRRYLAAATGAVALAGCQSGPGDSNTPTGDTGGSTAGGTTPDGSGSGPTVQVSEHAEYGQILVDAEGMTLYMFDSDTQGSGESTCSGGCLDAWPPLTVDGEATTGDGVNAELSTFERSDGDTQVAANGWPLYYYASDSSPGDVTGQGVNDIWWVLDPSGAPIKSSGSAPTPTPTATSGGGGGPQY